MSQNRMFLKGILTIAVLFIFSHNCYSQTAEKYLNDGKDFIKQKNFTQAMSDFNKALEINPKYAEAYYNRSLIYLIHRDFIQAISDCYKAIEIDPNKNDARILLAHIHFSLKEYDKVW